MKQMLEKSKNLTYLDNNVSILSSLNENSKNQLDLLVKELTKEYNN